MRSLLALSLCTAAALPAQNASTPDRARPAAVADVIHPIVTYRFVGWRGADLPTEVSLADSAGTFVASYRTARAGDVRPMSVYVRGEEVFLIGETAHGPLTIEFFERSRQSRDGALSGRWSLGSQEGPLRGRVERTAAAGAAPRS